jgi:hypothetical protein
MVMPLLLLKNIRTDSLKDKSLTNVPSFFTKTCKKMDPFWLQTIILNMKYNGMWRERKT